MGYATPDQIKARLEQLQNASPDQLNTIAEMIDEATVEIDDYLGFSFGDWGAAAQKAIPVSAPGGLLLLPAFKAGSITAVSSDTAGVRPITAYSERGRFLYISSLWRLGWMDYADPTSGNVYVTAIWGYGPPPADIVKVTIMIVARDWRSKDSGYSDVIGVDTGGVGYTKALPLEAKLILDKVKAKYRDPQVV